MKLVALTCAKPVLSEAQIALLKAPAGLDIGALTPEEVPAAFWRNSCRLAVEVHLFMRAATPAAAEGFETKNRLQDIANVVGYWVAPFVVWKWK